MAEPVSRPHAVGLDGKSTGNSDYITRVMPGVRPAEHEHDIDDQRLEDADPQAILARRLGRPVGRKPAKAPASCSRDSVRESKDDDSTSEGDTSDSDEDVPTTTVMRTPQPQSRNLGSKRGPAAKGGKRSVLVVEDVRVSQKLAMVALKKAKFKVEVAGDGEEAVRKFKSGHFDLVLMDINLPKMNGIDATRAIRRWQEVQGQTRATIFGLTGSLSETDVANYKAAEMDGVIAKGKVLTKALLEAIERHERDPTEFILSQLSVRPS